MLRVGIVGLGIGREHVTDGYAPLPDLFEVAALCDVDSERLKQGHALAPAARLTTDFADLLADPSIDIIDICTPPVAHLRQILAALAAGKRVICEKPLVASLADIDAILAAHPDAPDRLMPIFQYRYGDGLTKARHLIDSGLAGRAFVATVETFWRRTGAYYHKPWRGRWATELGGVLTTQAIHLHDMLTHLLGPVRAVSGRVATRVNGIEVEDCAVASLELESGALASLAATLGAQTQVSRLKLSFEHVTMESTPGPYTPAADPWRFTVADLDRRAAIESALASVAPTRPSYAGQFTAFAVAIGNGNTPPVTLADARGALELIAAIWHASRTGSTVTLPLPIGHPVYAGHQPIDAAQTAL